MKLLFLALLASLPLSRWQSRVHVDCLEVNTVYDPKDGRTKFEQVLIWERLPANGQYRIREWYMLTEMNSIGIPYKTEGGQWEAVVPTKKGSVKVYTDLYRETETPYDPERLDQKSLDPKYRLLLPKGK